MSLVSSFFFLLFAYDDRMNFLGRIYRLLERFRLVGLFGYELDSLRQERFLWSSFPVLVFLLYVSHFVAVDESGAHRPVVFVDRYFLGFLPRR